MTSSILTDLPATEFLQKYWQQQPILIRKALPNYASGLTADELAGLSLENEIESRIVIEDQNDHSWKLKHGPFTEQVFAQLPSTHWTLLVQAVDLWVPEVKALLRHFDFLPPWRLDDIMVSYASPGGSVGPHFDHYDVFLLQVEGNRRWLIGEPCHANTRLQNHSDLKLLADFEVHQEYLLEPGDMLYLPPMLAHWGIAEDECLTFSIGFRAPSVADLLGDLAIELSINHNNRQFTDPPLTPKMASETIDPAYVEHVQKLLIEAVQDKHLIADWLARYMTAPKYPDLTELTGEKRSATIDHRRYVNGESE